MSPMWVFMWSLTIVAAGKPDSIDPREMAAAETDIILKRLEEIDTLLGRSGGNSEGSAPKPPVRTAKQTIARIDAQGGVAVAGETLASLDAERDILTTRLVEMRVEQTPSAPHVPDSPPALLQVDSEKAVNVDRAMLVDAAMVASGYAQEASHKTEYLATVAAEFPDAGGAWTGETLQSAARKAHVSDLRNQEVQLLIALSSEPDEKDSTTRRPGEWSDNVQWWEDANEAELLHRAKISAEQAIRNEQKAEAILALEAVRAPSGETEGDGWHHNVAVAGAMMAREASRRDEQVHLLLQSAE